MQEITEERVLEMVRADAAATQAVYEALESNPIDPEKANLVIVAIQNAENTVIPDGFPS